MNFVKRALYSIKRRLGKSLLLFSLIFVLGNVIAGAIAVQQATTNSEASIRKSLGATVIVEFDYMGYSSKGNGEAIEGLSVDAINKMGSLPQVKHYDYSQTASGRVVDPTKAFKKDSEGGGTQGYTGMDGFVSFKGGQLPEVLDFLENRGKLVSGRTFTPEEIASGANKVIVSKEFADANGLSEGSRFTVQSVAQDYSNMMPKELGTKDFEVEVIGIYEPAPQTGAEGQMADFMEEMSQNTMYTTNGFVQEIVSAEEEILAANNVTNPGQDIPTQYSPVFVLQDPSMIEEFKQAIADVVPEYYKISTSSDTFKKIAGPVQTMQSLAGYTLYISVGASLLILSLLITLFLRDRKHELGIYLSLGETKVKVVSQIILEVVIVAFVSITLSLFTGNMIANQITETMIMNQLTAEQESSEDSGMMMISVGGSPLDSDISTEDILESYSVSLDAPYIIGFYVVGLGTVVFSTMLPMLYILRLNPKKIML